MEKIFDNPKQKVKCVFTDEGVTFTSNIQEFFYPYGAIDSIEMSFLGVLQVTHRAQICNFTVNVAERAELKKMVKYAKAAMKTAPPAEPRRIMLGRKKDTMGLSNEELLQKYKKDFISGVISKEEYDARRRQLKE